MRDARGNELAVGDKVLYVTRHSSSTLWHYGEVVELVNKVNYGQSSPGVKVRVIEESSWASRSDRLRHLGKPRNVIKLGADLP